MTEYDYSPEALDAYNRNQQRIARWAEDTSAHSHQYKSPFVPRSDAGSSDGDFYDRPTLPHRRSSSMGPPAAYNPVPAPNTYPPQPYSRANLPGPLPGPMPQFGAQYQHYAVSPPAVMSNSHGSLYRSHSQDTLSHHSHHRHKSHRSSRHHSKSPTYIIHQQTSPTYGPMVSPPLSTASNGVYYPQHAQAYTTFPQATTPPQMLSPTHVPYVYPFSAATAPSGMQYPYGYVQQQAQPQPQYIVVQGSKSRKSSKSRKVYYM